MDHTPLYKQLKNKILEDIVNQVYKPDELIPSQFEYAQKYGVSRVTVRQAINELIYNGILYTQKGKGTFVKNIPVDLQGYNRLGGFSENWKKTSQQDHTKVLQINKTGANKKLAEKLAMQIGQPIIHIQRLRMASGIQLTVENSYLNCELVENIDFFNELRDNVSLYKLLREKTSITFSYAVETINAVLADSEVSEQLNIKINEPILFVKRTTYMDNEIPFEYCENYARSDVYGVTVRYNSKGGVL